MELVKEYVDQYEARQPKTITINGLLSTSSGPDRNGRVYAEEEVRRAFTSFSGSDIIATFNGEVIGSLQAITANVERESAPIWEIGIPQTRSYEGTIAVENTEVNRDLLSELLGQSVQTIYIDEFANNQMPNREERRKKPSVKADEELHDGYRRGLQKMVGGRNRWNS